MPRKILHSITFGLEPTTGESRSGVYPSPAGAGMESHLETPGISVDEVTGLDLLQAVHEGEYSTPF